MSNYNRLDHIQKLKNQYKDLCLQNISDHNLKKLHLRKKERTLEKIVFLQGKEINDLAQNPNF